MVRTQRLLGAFRHASHHSTTRHYHPPANVRHESRIPPWQPRLFASQFIMIIDNSLHVHTHIPEWRPSRSPRSFAIPNHPSYVGYENMRECITLGGPRSFVPPSHPSNSESHEEDRTPLSETTRISNPTTVFDSKKSPVPTQPQKFRLIQYYEVDGNPLNEALLDLLEESRIFADDGKPWYNCKVCVESNPDWNPMELRDFGRHLTSVPHKKASIPCPVCPHQMFTRKDSMKRHLKAYHKRRFDMLYPEKKVKIRNV